MKRISDVMLKIFAIGITVCLFAGGLSFPAYVVGMIIGGENAAALCAFTYKSYLPWVIKLTSVFTGVGLIGMYLNQQKALTVETEDIKNADGKA